MMIVKWMGYKYRYNNIITLPILVEIFKGFIVLITGFLCNRLVSVYFYST